MIFGEAMYDFDQSGSIIVDTSKRIISLDELPYSIRRGFEAALAASSDSDWPSLRTRMGSAIFAGSRLLSVGANAFYKTKPGNKFFKVKADGVVTEYLKPLHAEQAALVKIRHRDYSRQKLSMFIWRSDAQGRPNTSAPCELCQSEIIKSGIKIVHFFAPGGLYGKWDVR